MLKYTKTRINRRRRTPNKISRDRVPLDASTAPYNNRVTLVRWHGGAANFKHAWVSM